MPRRGITLTEEEWRDVKARAAKNGLTVSEYISLALIDLSKPTRPVREVELAEVSLVPDTQANRDAGAGHVVGIGASRPAPKPGRKK